MNKINFGFSVFLILALILSAGLVSSVATPNKTNVTIENAENAIRSAKEDMQELSENGFNVQRINDTIKQAEQIFEAQKLLEKKGKEADYSLVISYYEEIAEIKEQAYEAKDKLYSLEQSYQGLIERVGGFDIDLSEINLLMQGIRQNMEDERYENVIRDVDNIEKSIVEIEAFATTFNLYYKATTRGIKSFLIENYIKIFLFIGLLGILFLVYWWKIYKIIIKRKIHKLKLEKKVLRKLIKDTQNAYFQEGKISESTYRIRIKKFGNLIRDIERKVPLLKETLAKTEKKLRQK